MTRSTVVIQTKNRTEPNRTKPFQRKHDARGRHPIHGNDNVDGANDPKPKQTPILNATKKNAVPLAGDHHGGVERGGGVVHPHGGEAGARVGRARDLGRNHGDVRGAIPGGVVEGDGPQAGPVLGGASIAALEI